MYYILHTQGIIEILVIQYLNNQNILCFIKFYTAFFINNFLLGEIFAMFISLDDKFCNKLGYLFKSNILWAGTYLSIVTLTIYLKLHFGF